MKTEFLLTKNQNYLFKIPWEHFILDDFFPEDIFRKFQTYLCSIIDGYSKREDDPFDLNFKFLPDLELAKFFIGDEFQTFLEGLTNKKLSLFEGGLVQLRLMTPDSPAFGPHVDDQNERSLVCILYLADWSYGNGGELNLLLDKESNPLDVSSKIVEPRANRMILFFSDDTNWHSVNKVYNWNRYSIISEWIVDGEVQA